MHKQHTNLILTYVAAATLATITPCAAATWWVDAETDAADADGSAAAPFATITAALEAVQPGDEVVVRGGVYRERFRVPSGEPGRPVVVRAADGERAIVSGTVPVEGWQSAGEGLWVAAMDFRPERLIVGGKVLPLAREPNEGWWRSQRAEADWLVDRPNLQGLQAAKTGGQLRVWLQSGNVFATLPIAAIDTQAGRVTLAATRRPVKLTDGDKYYLENRRAWIDRPGEWAVEPAGERFRVYLKPRDPGDLGHVEAPFQDRALVLVRDAGHVRIEGLEVTGGRHFGIEVHAATHVEVRRCIVHQNAYTGISLREATDSLVAQNIAWRNGYGISVGFSQGVTVEQNDVGHNEVDGVLVTWKSDDVTVRRNYVHHHLLWGHPDNMQVYREVTNVRFEDNLLLAAGQSLMMEETRDGVFAGNMVIGSGAYMLIFGHGNAGHYRVANNTLALSGYGCLSLTWEDYELTENVMMTGHGSFLFGVRGVEGYRGDRNLFWNTARAENPGVIATDAGWHKSFSEVQQATGQEQRSVYADPRFRNAPIALGVLDWRRLHECTRETWYLRQGGSELFRAGDYVEVDFDGVRRRVTGVDQEAGAITVEPPLPEAPIKDCLVANWGERAQLRLDLRLANDSPGAKLSADGGPVGSRIDVQAYQRGDFNGDGRRDLPELPPDVAAGPDH